MKEELWSLTEPTINTYLELPVCSAEWEYTTFSQRNQSRWELWTPVYLLEEETHQQRNHQEITTEEGEGGSWSKLTSSQDRSGNYRKQTTEQDYGRTLKTSFPQKNQIQYKLSTPAQQNIRRGGWSDPQLTSWREGSTKEIPNNKKTPKTYTELT